MPSVEKLPSGRYRGLYRDANGERQRVPGTFDRKSDAKDAAVEAEGKAKRQAASKSDKLSPKTGWGDWWDAIVVDRQFASDTPRNEANHVRKYVRPQWGSTPLVKLEQPEIQAWVDSLSRLGLKPRTVRRIYGVFRVSISIAVERKILTADPCAGVKLPRIVKKPKIYIEPTDVAELGDELKQPWRDAIEFMLETGMRPGELAGLHAHRVSTRARRVTVNEVYVFKSKFIREWPKDDEVRVVPLTSKAEEIYNRRTANRDLKTGCGVPHFGGTPCTHALVFTVNGRPLSPNSLGEALSIAAGRAGVDHKTPYGARRGYATRLAEAGIDAFLLADLLGHSDLSITREYVQQTQAAQGRVLAALGESQPLKAVGPRGTDRGTDRDNQEFPEAPEGASEETA
ncbi:site-specific integrase [Amycolatopsis sp. NPDC051128]|uniref:tyrosine-type recombinase/integrase n=1 Tax=Amycolatopsis sp. NPDC051128 TaxID=3155412 RepID=UPI0034354946